MLKTLIKLLVVFINPKFQIVSLLFKKITKNGLVGFYEIKIIDSNTNIDYDIRDDSMIYFVQYVVNLNQYVRGCPRNNWWQLFISAYCVVSDMAKFPY